MKIEQEERERESAREKMEDLRWTFVLVFVEKGKRNACNLK